MLIMEIFKRPWVMIKDKFKRPPSFKGNRKWNRSLMTCFVNPFMRKRRNKLPSRIKFLSGNKSLNPLLSIMLKFSCLMRMTLLVSAYNHQTRIIIEPLTEIWSKVLT